MQHIWLPIALSMTGIIAQTASVPFKHTNMHTGNNIKAHSNTSELKNNLREGGKLPTIFIIGAQKGGSSSLYELMVKHPQLCGGDRKENHYFDHPLNYEMGTAYFKSMYFDEKCNKVKGTHFVDGTPILHYPSVWQRIYDTYNDNPHVRDSLKFIVMLREPASRDYSWYEHVTRTDVFMGEKFRDIKTMNETFVGNYSIFKKGYYVNQLVAFTNVFKRSQIMVISSVGMYKDTSGMMENIRKFINVEEHDSFLSQLPHDDHLSRFDKLGIAECITAHVPLLDCWIRDAMADHYIDYNEKLYSWLDSTRSIADPNEPPFEPKFASPRLLPCESDSRAVFNKVLEVDSRMSPPKETCVVPHPHR